MLANTLQKAGALPADRASYLYRPYRLTGGEAPLTLFFRDDRLSDLIGTRISGIGVGPGREQSVMVHDLL